MNAKSNWYAQAQAALALTDKSRPYAVRSEDIGDKEKSVVVFELIQVTRDSHTLSVATFSNIENVRVWCQVNRLTLVED